MKISVPFIVWEAQRKLMLVLPIIFRGAVVNCTELHERFVPRKIETRRVSPKGDEPYETHIKMWADGVYITAIATGWERDEMEVTHLQFRVRRSEDSVALPDSLWAEFQIFVGGGNTFLVAEHYPNVKSHQDRKLQEIHEFLK